MTKLPDGSGQFTQGMGMQVNKDDLGFGDRSWRYPALLRDGVIDALFVEDRGQRGNPFSVNHSDPSEANRCRLNDRQLVQARGADRHPLDWLPVHGALIRRGARAGSIATGDTADDHAYDRDDISQFA